MRLFRITFDETCKDIDLWLKGQTDREQAVQGLMKSAKPVLKSLKDVISDHKFWTFTIYGPKRNPDAGETGELIFDWFSQAGRFYMDMNRNACCLYYRSTVYDISNSSVPFTSLLYEESGLISSAGSGKDIVNVLKAKTWSHGEHVMGMFWLHTNHTAQTVWFNLCNERNEIIRISPGSTEVMKNGINPDNVMLIASPVMKGITFMPETDIQEAMNLFHERVMKNLCCTPANRYYLACILLNTLLTQFTEARGITKIFGDHSKGKSSMPKFLSTIVYGHDTTGTGSAAASYSEGMQNPLIVEDNLENRDITNEIKKFLLIVATGGNRRKRKQGTDSDVVYEKLCTQVIVTAIEPFTEDELINRSVEIEIDRIKYGNPDFPGDMAVMAEIAEARDRIWSGIFKLIALEVMPDFREKRMNALRMLAKEYPGHAKERLNELFSCLFLICRALLKYMPHPEYSADPEKAAGEILDQWITKQNHQQDETLSETNVILNLLEVLVQEYLHNPKGFADDYRFEPEYSGGVKDEWGRWKSRPGSVSFVLPTRTLHSAFLMLKRTRNCEYPYLKVGTLGSRLSDSKEVLTRNGWKYEQKVKTVRGSDYHRFTRQTSEE